MNDIAEYPALKRQMIEMQETLLHRALAKTGGNKTQAAKTLKICRRQLQRICERYDAAHPPERQS